MRRRVRCKAGALLLEELAEITSRGSARPRSLAQSAADQKNCAAAAMLKPLRLHKPTTYEELLHRRQRRDFRVVEGGEPPLDSHEPPNPLDFASDAPVTRGTPPRERRVAWAPAPRADGTWAAPRAAPTASTRRAAPPAAAPAAAAPRAPAAYRAHAAPVAERVAAAMAAADAADARHAAALDARRAAPPRPRRPMPARPPPKPATASVGVQTKALRKPPPPPAPAEIAARDERIGALLAELTRSDGEWRRMVTLLESQLKDARQHALVVETLLARRVAAAEEPPPLTAAVQAAAAAKSTAVVAAAASAALRRAPPRPASLYPAPQRLCAWGTSAPAGGVVVGGGGATSRAFFTSAASAFAGEAPAKLFGGRGAYLDEAAAIAERRADTARAVAERMDARAATAPAPRPEPLTTREALAASAALAAGAPTLRAAAADAPPASPEPRRAEGPPAATAPPEPAPEPAAAESLFPPGAASLSPASSRSASPPSVPLPTFFENSAGGWTEVTEVSVPEAAPPPPREPPRREPPRCAGARAGRRAGGRRAGGRPPHRRFEQLECCVVVVGILRVCQRPGRPPERARGRGGRRRRRGGGGGAPGDAELGGLLKESRAALDAGVPVRMRSARELLRGNVPRR